MMKQKTGYNSRVLQDPQIIVNDVLSDNLGSTGKLLNITDPRLDSARKCYGPRSQKTNQFIILKPLTRFFYFQSIVFIVINI